MKLYHYTTIKNLALILDSKKILFNRLDNVDDAEESLYSSGPMSQNISKYIYVSCWTKEERENLALWKMYAGYDGIRIGLDENMFISFPNSPFNTFRSFYSKIAYFGNGYCADQYTNKIKIYDVQYSDDLKGIVSNLVHLDNGKLSINTSDAGLIKRTEWYMQKESRFKIQVLPLNYSYIPYKAEQLNNMDRLQLTEANIKVVPALIQSIKEDYDPSVPYIFMPLRTEAINSMEIMMGPCTNKADRIIVESLLKDLRNSKIYNSKFKDVIRK